MNDIKPHITDDSPKIFSNMLREKYGQDLLAVVLYGSWLRGRRDTVIDLYVILDSYKPLKSRFGAALNHIVAPNVYHMTTVHAGQKIATKYATVTRAVFKKRISRDFHPYFWARFAQPSVLLYLRDQKMELELKELFRCATKRLIRRTAPLLPSEFSTIDLWETAFGLTYRCELRSESENTPKILAAHMNDISPTLAIECSLKPAGENRWESKTNQAKSLSRILWFSRIIIGKVFCALRLFKALFTFDNPLDYLVWKIERHTGIKENPTELQRKYPLLFSWPLLWRIFKRGGFR